MPNLNRTVVALCRASTSWQHGKKDVDGRDKPGHDEIERMRCYSACTPESATILRQVSSWALM
jgi:hypothetical protein